jgi:hypothetical protein
MDINVEGGEFGITNPQGDFAIIPKHKRQEVLNYLESGDYDKIDDIVNDLPVAEDYAEDGTIVPDDEGKKKMQEELQKTGTTSERTFDTQNPIYKRLSKNMHPYDYAGLPERFKEAVIHNKMNAERKAMEELPLLEPGQELDKDRMRLDVIKMYSGEPQKHGTFSISEHSPKNAKDPNAVYYSINDRAYVRNLLQNIDGLKSSKKNIAEEYSKLAKTPEEMEAIRNKAYIVSTRTPRNTKLDKFANSGVAKLLGVSEGFKDLASLQDYDKSINEKEYTEALNYFKNLYPNLDTNSDEFYKKVREFTSYNPKTGGIYPEHEGALMQHHFVTFNKDERGEYASYYDKWDINPFPKLEKAGVDLNFGKPLELYDRIYYKDYNGEKKRMFFTDNELYNVNPESKTIDINKLQEELLNRGYELPTSFSEEGIPYGKINKETLEALNKYKKSYKGTKKTPEYIEGYKKSIKPI